MKTEWIYGINTLVEALKSEREILSVYISKDTRNIRIKEVNDRARAKGIPVRLVDKGFFSRFSNAIHQGVAALSKRKEFLDIKGLTERAATGANIPLFVILDRIEDPRNLGAVIRTSECAGVSGVVLQRHNSVGITSIVEKSSSGAASHVLIAVVPNIKQAIEFLQEKGVYIIGADAGGERRLWEIDMTVPCALVFGSEGKGIRRTVKERCDVIANLPMAGTVNSLNISVAAGIFVFEALRQRSLK